MFVIMATVFTYFEMSAILIKATHTSEEIS